MAERNSASGENRTHEFLAASDQSLGAECLRAVRDKLTGKIVLELHFVNGVMEQPAELLIKFRCT